jgi:hypothetical protein
MDCLLMCLHWRWFDSEDSPALFDLGGGAVYYCQTLVFWCRSGVTVLPQSLAFRLRMGAWSRSGTICAALRKCGLLREGQWKTYPEQQLATQCCR